MFHVGRICPPLEWTFSGYSGLPKLRLGKELGELDDKQPDSATVPTR